MSSLHNKGFTLVELIIVMAVIALLFFIAITEFQTTQKKQQPLIVIKQIQLLINHARVYASTNSRDVIVCASKSGVDCSDASTQYIISFVDYNQDKQRQADEPILKTEHYNLDYGTLTINIGLQRHFIRFFADTGAPRGYQANITYCPNNKNSQMAKSIIMNKHGATRLSQDSDGDGFDEDTKGKRLCLTP